MAQSKVTTHYRRADKGTYTTKEFAVKHPTITVKETDRPRKASGK